MTTVIRSPLYTGRARPGYRAKPPLYRLCQGCHELGEYHESVTAFSLCVLLAQVPAPAPSTAAPADELLQIKTVYILPMSRAFDQYLATHLTRGGLIQVVTDPQKADAVLTEQLGKNFEDQMEELYPKPKAPAPLSAEEEEEAPANTPAALLLELKDPEGRPRSTFGRGRGTVFLVHRSTGNVVWSTYLRPKSPVADVLNDAARQVADQMKDAFKKRQAVISKQLSGGK